MLKENYNLNKLLARFIVSHKNWDGTIQLALAENPKGEIVGLQIDQKADLVLALWESQILKQQVIGNPYQINDWLISVIGKENLNHDLKFTLLFFRFAGGDEGEAITESIDIFGNSNFTREYTGISAASEPDDLIPHSYDQKLNLEEVIKHISKRYRMIIDTRNMGYSWVTSLEWRGFMIDALTQLIGTKSNDLPTHLPPKSKQELEKIYSIAKRFLELGAGEDSEKIALKILESNPNEAPFWILRSQALILLGRHDESLDDAKTALSLDPTNLEYIYHYFSVCLVKDQPQSCLDYINGIYESLSKEKKDDVLGFIEQSLVAGVLGKFDLNPKIMGALVIRRQNRE